MCRWGVPLGITRSAIGSAFFFRKFFWSGAVARKSAEEEQKFIFKVFYTIPRYDIFRRMLLEYFHIYNETHISRYTKKIELLFFKLK
jgi:hypothetical protein